MTGNSRAEFTALTNAIAREKMTPKETPPPPATPATASRLDQLWDHFLDVAQYDRKNGEKLRAARAAIEAEAADAERIATARAARISRVVARLPRTEAGDYIWAPLGDVLVAITDPDHAEIAWRPPVRLDTLLRGVATARVDELLAGCAEKGDDFIDGAEWMLNRWRVALAEAPDRQHGPWCVQDSDNDSAEPFVHSEACRDARLAERKMTEFTIADLTELQDEGVLMAANERFFWPLGLALTWNHDSTGTASDLHIRQWDFENGQRETIALDPADPVGPERRARFAAWLEARIAALPADERAAAATLRVREHD